MKIILLLGFILCHQFLSARILHVGSGQPYANLQQAASNAQSGDTIFVHSGVYQGGQYITNLRGTPSAWITILAESNTSVIFRGGTEAWHLTDAAYLRIEGFVFESQTGNGVNIDDGGSYDTPAHHITIERCEWRAMNATGNNDQLKLSGLDSFTVANCRFLNGSAGGSAVDMVGCHWGVFERNYFENAGSNCIQTKGGSQYIRIERNRFINGGQRALNIGGSTDPQYFRPITANFEASHVAVYANIFTGSMAPVAYVGAVNCEVVNNTIYRPDKWAVRILQETVGPNYLPCGNNIFRNNIVFITNVAANATLNIGPNTAPETFIFTNNLWFNVDNAGWQGPNLPVAETNGIIGRDPKFRNAVSGDFAILATSPAIGRGMQVQNPISDFAMSRFNTPRSIGAYEGNIPTALGNTKQEQRGFQLLQNYPNPVFSRDASAVTIRFTIPTSGNVCLTFYHSSGQQIRTLIDDALHEGVHAITFRVDEFPIGLYFYRLEMNGMMQMRAMSIL